MMERLGSEQGYSLFVLKNWFTYVFNLLNCAFQSIYCIYCEYCFLQNSHKATLVQALHKYYLHTFPYDLLSTFKVLTALCPLVDQQSSRKTQGTLSSTRRSTSKTMRTRVRSPLDCLWACRMATTRVSSAASLLFCL